MFEELRARVVVPAALLVLAVAAPARGQVGGGNGFLFGAPSGQISIRAGYSQPSAGSDLFTESFQTFSLQRSSLGAPDLGAELGINLLPQLDLTLGIEFAGRSRNSDYRHFVDNNNNPIEQTTTFQRIPVTAGLKAYLLPPGRSIGSLAWIPSSVVPWVGAAVGMTHYRFAQEGDFIGPQGTDGSLPVYSDKLESSGWGYTGQASAGVDVSISARTAVTLDARYTRAHATLDRNYFSGYNDLDLSGASVALGLTFRL
jgi:hypothetical protein